MIRPLSPRFVLMFAAAFVALPEGSALAAAPKDGQAEKALADAMDNEYLQTRFDKAEKKLKAAIDACGASGCTPALKAKLYVALATVLAGGMKQLEDAREAFVEALKLDKNAKPDPDLTSSEIAFAFEQAQKELKIGGAGSSGQGAASGDVKHSAPAEQKVKTPVPLFIELSPELAEKAKKAVVSYKGPDDSDFRSLIMKKVGERGYGMNVPCNDLENEGSLQYFITVTDESGAILGSAGSRSEPLTTAIKAKLSGDPPHWPGFAPPDTCSKDVLSRPQQCIDDRECSKGLMCSDGTCVPKPTDGTTKPKGDDRRLNRISLSIVPDLSLFSGDNVCNTSIQSRDHFVCLRPDETRYVGTPTSGVADNVNLGFLFSSLRATLGYDRVLIDNLTIGLRAGAAIVAPTAAEVSFFRVHIEGRAAYWIGNKPFEHMGARPFVFVSGGAAQYNSKVDVEVLEDGAACGAAKPDDFASPCTKASSDGTIEERTQTLSVYKQAGLGFISLGGGIEYAPTPAVAINLGLRVSLTVPVVTTVFSPEAGIAVGF